MRTLYRRWVPLPLRRWLRRQVDAIKLVGLYWRDMQDYARHSTTFVSPEENREMLEARITAHYHVVEKGLSFDDTRVGFGEWAVKSLIRLLGAYKQRYAQEPSVAFDAAIGTLLKYVEFNETHGHPVDEVKAGTNELKQGLAPGGTVLVHRQQLLEGAGGDFAALCASRRSVRSFTDREVEMDLIRKALALAQTAPSVCNRQTARVHVVAARELIDRLLKLQGGTRGFSHRVNKVLVVSSTLHGFDGTKERNQSFVDGGLYAMNLLYGLHYSGLGACPLIWCAPPTATRETKRFLRIPAHERLVMLIAVGHLPETFEVAESRRFPIERIYRVVDGSNA